MTSHEAREDKHGIHYDGRIGKRMREDTYGEKRIYVIMEGVERGKGELFVK